MRKHRAALAAALASAAVLAVVLPAAAQAERPVVAVLPFTGADFSENEARSIEHLVQSYVSELREFRLASVRDRDRVLGEWEYESAVSPETSRDAGALLKSDFLLAGTVAALDGQVALTLEIVKVRTGEKKSVSGLFRTLGEAALGSRSLVSQIFERASSDAAAEKADAAVSPADAEVPQDYQAAPTEAQLAGTWTGDRGVEQVRVMRGGRAVAYLSSGARMELTFAVEGPVVAFRQNSPNTEKFYHPLPFKVARDLASVARPFEWRFRLSVDGTSLRGTKTSSAARYEGEKLLEVVHGVPRDAEWTRKR